MSKALALVEIGSWSTALVVLDAMEKQGTVRLLQVELNDAPGVCLKLLASVADAASCLRAAQAIAGRMQASILVHSILNPSQNCSPAWQAPPEFNPLIEQSVIRNLETDVSNQSGFALGLIETQGFIGVFEAIDTAVKTASVEVLAREKLGGGYITVVIKGDVGSVRAAVEAGKQKVEGLGRLVAAHVIPNPSESVLSLLSKLDRA